MDELDPIDVEIGRRVRDARVLARLTQKDLGDRIGVTSQQVQKYEAGRSRMAVSTLCRAADAMEVPPATLVGGLLGRSVRDTDALAPRERELVEAFRALAGDAQRAALLKLIHTLPALNGS